MVEKQKSIKISVPPSRIGWIDVCKAFAIFFIFFGHWKTTNGNLEIFAYSFHLQLFFIISGFFAEKQQIKRASVFLSHQFHKIFIPFLFFTVVNIIYFDLDGKKLIRELSLEFITNFTDYAHSVSAQLWFLPALFAVSIAYYFLLKAFHKPVVILAVGYVLYIIWACFKNTAAGIILVPFVKVIGISSIPEYLIWYSLGSLTFSKINGCADLLCGKKSDKKFWLNCIGGVAVFLMAMIYMFKPDKIWSKITFGFGNIPDFIYQNFRIFITLILCAAFMYLSVAFRNCVLLQNIGQNTLILMGFEFLAKDFLVLNFIPMFNVGIIKLDSTLQVMTISVMTVFVIRFSFKPLNKYVPYLVGK